MIHNSHCNHSYRNNANHSFNFLCNDTYMEGVNELIKRKRLNLGLSQHEVGSKIGVSHVAVGKWESGATQSFKLENIVGMLKLFNIQFGDLVGDASLGCSVPQAPEPSSPCPQTTSEMMAALVDHLLKGHPSDLKAAPVDLERMIAKALDPDARAQQPPDKLHAPKEKAG